MPDKQQNATFLNKILSNQIQQYIKKDHTPRSTGIYSASINH